MPIFSNIELTHPWLLLTSLLAVPALWWSRAAHGRVMFSSLSVLPGGGGSWRTRLAWLPEALLVTTILTLAVALAGPRSGDDNARVRREGIAMVMAVDISGSMRALDLSERERELTRLDAVKQVFVSFVLGKDGLRGRPDDAIGLVSFAGHADTRSPITLDHGNLVEAARQLELVTERSEDGTALGDGLALAVERLRQHPATSKVAVLLTDGVETAGTLAARNAIELAVESRIKVYTVGAGTNGVAPVRVDTEMGPRLMQVDVEIDEATLQEIARRTGGQYFRATDLEVLKQVYQQIDALERTILEENVFLDYTQHYPPLLALGLSLLVISLLLRSTLFRRLP
jgi:Ca-activated chloride channel family protein